MLASSIISYAFITIDLIIDGMIAGQFIGEDAVSAIGIVAPYTTLISFFSTMFSQGVGIVFTQKIGAYKDKEAKKICGMGLSLSILLGIFLVILMLTTKKNMLIILMKIPRIEYFNCLIR